MVLVGLFQPAGVFILRRIPLAGSSVQNLYNSAISDEVRCPI